MSEETGQTEAIRMRPLETQQSKKRIGVLLWFVNAYIPMDRKIKNILNIVVVIVIVLWLLQVFAILGSLDSIRVGG